MLIQLLVFGVVEQTTAGIVASLMLVYGFPYMLALPPVWDIAKRNTHKHLNQGEVFVQNIETIDYVSSINYLCI